MGNDIKGPPKPTYTAPTQQTEAPNKVAATQASAVKSAAGRQIVVPEAVAKTVADLAASGNVRAALLALAPYDANLQHALTRGMGDFHDPVKSDVNPGVELFASVVRNS